MTIRATDAGTHDEILKGIAEKAIKVDLSKYWKISNFTSNKVLNKKDTFETGVFFKWRERRGSNSRPHA